MSDAFAAPACVFLLGCALIHAARSHAAVVTRILAGVTLVAAACLLLMASLACVPDNGAAFADLTVDGAE